MRASLGSLPGLYIRFRVSVSSRQVARGLLLRAMLHLGECARFDWTFHTSMSNVITYLVESYLGLKKHRACNLAQRALVCEWGANVSCTFQTVGFRWDVYLVTLLFADFFHCAALSSSVSWPIGDWFYGVKFQNLVLSFAIWCQLLPADVTLRRFQRKVKYGWTKTASSRSLALAKDILYCTFSQSFSSSHVLRFFCLTMTKHNSACD